MAKKVNMNDKSKVINLCNYPVSWERKTISGDEWIQSGGSTYISNFELETQKDNGNKFITGTDSIGSHASIYIDNSELREQFGFDDKEEDRKQLIIDDAKCVEILESTVNFQENLEFFIVTPQEKMKIMEIARNIKLNDYEKILDLESYTSMKYRI